MGSLAGWRIAVTRSAHQAGALSQLIANAGAVAVEVPTIAIAEPDDGGAALAAALGRLERFDWIVFSSANAVSRVLSLLEDGRALSRARVAAVGTATARALRDAGVAVSLVPERANAEELADALGAAVGSKRVLIPQAAEGRDVLRRRLGELGYDVEAVAAYRTVPAPADPDLTGALGSCDAVTFASPSSIDGFLAAYGRELLPPIVVTIGSVTTAAALHRGIDVAGEAATASAAGIVEALEELADRMRPHP